MVDLVYRTVMKDIKQKIINGDYPQMKLPDERSLSQQYAVSRSSIKRALEVLVRQGIIFKKRGSGTFINPLYLKKQAMFSYEGSNLGITDSYQFDGKVQRIEVKSFQVIPATPEIQTDLFLKPTDFVYEIKRIRYIDDQPFILETGYIPIKIVPTISEEVVQGSVFNYIEAAIGKTVTRSYVSVSAAPSTEIDQELLQLKPTEPVAVLDGVFFLDDGTPFEVSNMRFHYQYMRYNTFTNINGD